MKLSQPVTWDNPDVKILRGGIEQYTYDLVANTDYELEITVHNASRDKPANGTIVDVRWIEFGAGSQIRHAIANLPANIPVWPATSKVHTTWRTPATPGHYCLEIELSHPNDGNPANNRGWNNTQVKSAQSQVETPIRIFNQLQHGGETAATSRPRRWLELITGWGGGGLAVGIVAAFAYYDRLPWWGVLFWSVAGYLAGLLAGYAIRGEPPRGQKPREVDPTQVPAGLVELDVDSYRFDDHKGKDADLGNMFAPRPPAWPAKVEPATFHFAAGETFRDVRLIVDAPDQAGATDVFNVNARQGNAPIGGVTVTVTRPGGA